MEQLKADVGPGEGEKHLVQLGPTMCLRIELLAAKRRTAELEEKVAVFALREARRIKREAEVEEAALMRAVSDQLKLPAGKNVRLVDRERGICSIED